MSEEVNERIEFILESILLIENRFLKIKFPDDLINSNDGITILDSIAMRLQAIGDNIKSIHKLDNQFLQKFPEIEWEKIMKMRDIISHHYEGLDHEIIFNICKNKIPELKISITSILKQLNGG
ncbi:HepT-like ribonuclease domain-containing protein [Leptospira kanakyensis]|uniref:HepT-like ribonuclease domain-containing protein n=1 Tax=Leptospira kanakyensis TaxID=2484968 RepID=UPI00223DF160|nr:HepT-like ribonuclease domain-containing protein [Leptospira kanakyensis]MCW7471685.1 DUF86 domain-containing protein [Leptospira kanakyensis]MCW7483292.1 DUF86 domain-containing protein [Leptospira kanakyensis]